MPINSNKSSLKVETIIGDKTYENEEVTNIYYQRNIQNTPQRKAGSHSMDAKVYGRPSTDEEFEMPPEMEKALNDDLTTKGVQPKKRRTKKTTTTEKTND